MDLYKQQTPRNQVLSIYLNSLHAGKFGLLFCRLLFFFKINFFGNKIRNTFRVSNSLDPDQAGHLIGPDLGQNCLPRLSADDKTLDT